MGEALAGAVSGLDVIPGKPKLSQNVGQRTKNADKIERFLVAPTGIEPLAQTADDCGPYRIPQKPRTRAAKLLQTSAIECKPLVDI